ncbi:MAG: XRE family transcriptional regulator [Defluviitaleaceae bacterium]|nr:XRE family transcriptional regulator [Defluviitaleaceae bacterium]
MLNLTKLNNEIKRKGLTISTLANSIGVCRTTFHRKLKNDGDTFMLWEIESIIKYLELTKSVLLEIFFS